VSKGRRTFHPTDRRRTFPPTFTVTAGAVATVDFLNLAFGDATDSNAVDWSDIGPFSASYGAGGDTFP
jgi:hypothetical protein